MNIRSNRAIVDVVLYLLIGFGLSLRIIALFSDKSLWLDEAMLASSLCSRNLFQLISKPLDFGQSSPIGWLLIEKILLIICGPSEIVLRCFSFISAICCIVIICKILRGKVDKSILLAIVVIISLTEGYICYSYELKPYMSDNFFCLLVMYIWQKYKEGMTRHISMVIYYAIIIWFSFAAVFFIAACMIIDSIMLLKIYIEEIDRRLFWKLMSNGIVLLSFVSNYIFWLSKTQNNAGGAGYWALLKWPIFPQTYSDCKLMIKMAWQFWAFFSWYTALLFIVAIVVFIYMVVKRKQDESQLLLPWIVSLLLLLIASACGFYPIQDRLVQVYAMIGLLFVGIGSTYFCKKTSHINTIIVFLLFFISIFDITVKSSKYINTSNIYKRGSEVIYSIDYLNTHLSTNDALYLYVYSIPVYLYETGYDVTFDMLSSKPIKHPEKDQYISSLPEQVGKVIYGQTLVEFDYVEPYSYDNKVDWDAIEEDVELIAKNKSVYLFVSHSELGVDELLSGLSEYGEVKLVSDYYNTHLYHFKSDI